MGNYGGDSVKMGSVRGQAPCTVFILSRKLKKGINKLITWVEIMVIMHINTFLKDYY
jgi:hypothetical protein